MKLAGLSAMVAVLLGFSNFGGRPLRPPHWGGVGIALNVQSLSSQVELDCAQGTITQQFRIDRHGNFDLPGTYEAGPIVLPPSFHPAHYVGASPGARYPGGQDKARLPNT